MATAQHRQSIGCSRPSCVYDDQHSATQHLPNPVLSHRGLSATRSCTEFVYSQPNCRVTRSVPAPQWGLAQRSCRSKKGREELSDGASETAELQAKVRQNMAVEVLDAAREHPGADKRRRVAAGRPGSASPLISGNNKKGWRVQVDRFHFLYSKTDSKKSSAS